MLVVEREGPEAAHGRERSLGKGDGVAVIAVELTAVFVEVLIEVLGLVGRVDEDVGFADGETCVVVGAEARSVVLRGPVMRQRDAVVVELEERSNDVLVGLDSSGYESSVDLGVLLCGVEAARMLA